MARLRPTEVKAVISLLDSPADDVGSLAESVLHTINEMRAKRDLYVAVMWQPRIGLVVFGTYDTQKQAEKALSKDIVACVEGARGGVYKVRRPGGVDDET